jgi:chromosome partitioning protein
MAMKKIVAVVNQKGGVGKTTTSINLSAALSMKGKKVLLIDLDPQAHSTIGLGIEPRNFKTDIKDVLVSKRNIKDAILPTRVQNLYLVPSNLRLDRAEQQLSSAMFRETFLSKAIKPLDYDFIIIDCRPALGTLTINALYACNFIIIPCEISRYALEGFSDLLETVENVKSNNTRKKEKFIRILITKYESRNKVSNDWVWQQLEPYKSLIFKTLIRKNEALNQAHMAQETIFTYRDESLGAEDYKQLCEEFLKVCLQAETN